GDKVRVTATVDEFNGLTELTNVSEIATLDTGVQLPTVTVITIGLDADYEAVEGMRVELVSGSGDPLTVIENFNLDRYGEVVVSEGIQTQPTQIYDAQAQQAEIDALAEQNAANRLLVEDNITGQNPDTHVLIDAGDGTPLEAGDPITKDGPTLRLGSELTSVTGIMNYAFGDYRLQVDAPLDVVEGTGERPDAVPDVGGDLQVASFNVLNFFTTIDEPGAGTGPNGDLDPRGADTAAEYTRQLDKLVTAILELDAEVIGLQELENNGFGPGSAIAALVDALNAALGADVYSFVDPGTDFVGTDAITTGVIYKHDVVTLTGVAVLNYEESSADETWAIVDEIQSLTGTDPVSDFDRNRPTIAATFEDNDGSAFTVAVNHYKSKGDSGLYDLLEDAVAAGVSAELILALIQDPNFDQGDGQGFWNQVRTDAALELANWLQTNPTGAGSTDNLVLLGDLNSYAMEDPVQALIDAGFSDLAQALIGTSAYSYVFDGQQGTLDYALASGGLLDNITGAAEWHINADEPDLLNYDTSFNNPAFYNDDPFAVSDHDPMLIGLELDDPSISVSYEFWSNDRGNRDKITYYEEGEKLDVACIRGPQKVINLHQDGIYIDGFDGLRGKDWLTIDKNGLGVLSQFGDRRGDGSLRKGEINMLDDEESIVFHLTNKGHVGDGLDVAFEFGKVRGAGEVTLIFRDDGVVVDEVDLTIVDDMVAYDLVGNTTFNEVEIAVGESTKVQISALDIERLAPADHFDFLGS
ncbi:MAG: ExeM/NucH family extracellular endonuclease, partial [Maritimibacter sp.]|nr:ExeM/NucH family extracellular endonuclease [Maritimibacter sp.]